MIEKLIRPNILRLKPYASARSQYFDTSALMLDANENPYGSHNRYPDPYQLALKQKLADTKQVSVDQILVGNGGDEVIDLLQLLFCCPGRDKILVCPPTYGMYAVSAQVNDLEVVEVPLTADFQLDINQMKVEFEADPKIKMVFLCSPNNPTANLLDNMEEILRHFQGIVVLDEAYIDFSSRESMITKLDQFPRLVVIQTLSKAFGLAAARIGMGFASPEMIRYLNKMKPPYNVGTQNQLLAIQSLENQTVYQLNKALILQQRSWLEDQLQELSFVQQIFPSQANFLLVRVANAGMVYQQLLARGIIIRNRHHEIENCLRITVGTENENIQLMQALKEIEQPT